LPSLLDLELWRAPGWYRANSMDGWVLVLCCGWMDLEILRLIILERVLLGLLWDEGICEILSCRRHWDCICTSLKVAHWSLALLHFLPFVQVRKVLLSKLKWWRLDLLLLLGMSLGLGSLGLLLLELNHFHDILKLTWSELRRVYSTHLSELWWFLNFLGWLLSLFVIAAHQWLWDGAASPPFINRRQTGWYSGRNIPILLCLEAWHLRQDRLFVFRSVPLLLHFNLTIVDHLLDLQRCQVGLLFKLILKIGDADVTVGSLTPLSKRLVILHELLMLRRLFLGNRAVSIVKWNAGRGNMQ